MVRACAAVDVAPESALAVEVEGVEVAIVHSGDRYYAIADECSHAAIPLSEGDVGNGEIELAYRHSTALSIYGGSSEIMRSIIAQLTLRMPRSRS